MRLLLSVCSTKYSVYKYTKEKEDISKVHCFGLDSAPWNLKKPRDILTKCFGDFSEPNDL